MVLKKKKIIVRVGDLIRYVPLGYGSYYAKKSNSDKIREGIVLGTQKSWYCIKNHISIDQQILPIKNILEVVTKREKLTNYWKYLDDNWVVSKNQKIEKKVN